MDFRVQEKQEIILKVGDCLVKENKLYTVVICSSSSNTEEYSIKGIDQDRESMLTRSTLKELTKNALRCDYKIYSQNEWELVLQRKVE